MVFRSLKISGSVRKTMIFLTRQTNKANLNYVSIRRELKCVALPQADSKRMSEYAMKRSKCFTDLD